MISTSAATIFEAGSTKCLAWRNRAHGMELLEPGSHHIYLSLRYWCRRSDGSTSTAQVKIIPRSFWDEDLI